MKTKILTQLALVVSLAVGLQSAYISDSEKQIVIDKVSGLIWQEDSDAKTITKTWSEAIAYCEAKELGGYSDWRLPNFSELSNISYRTRKSLIDSPISPVFREIVLGDYWSSTSDVSNSGRAWKVFSIGRGEPWEKTSRYNVRCVRGGQ